MTTHQPSGATTATGNQSGQPRRVVLKISGESFAQTGQLGISPDELMVIGGTSLTVYPAASFVSLCKGKVVIVNKSPTMMDRSADLVIAAPIGEVFAALMPFIEGELAIDP